MLAVPETISSFIPLLFNEEGADSLAVLVIVTGYEEGAPSVLMFLGYGYGGGLGGGTPAELSKCEGTDICEVEGNGNDEGRRSGLIWVGYG